MCWVRHCSTGESSSMATVSCSRPPSSSTRPLLGGCMTPPMWSGARCASTRTNSRSLGWWTRCTSGANARTPSFRRTSRGIRSGPNSPIYTSPFARRWRRRRWPTHSARRSGRSIRTCRSTRSSPCGSSCTPRMPSRVSIPSCSRSLLPLPSCWRPGVSTGRCCTPSCNASVKWGFVSPSAPAPVTCSSSSWVTVSR